MSTTLSSLVANGTHDGEEAFTWTPWESGTFLLNVDYTTDRAMDHYVKDLEHISLSSQRKNEVEDPMIVGWMDASHATRPDGKSTEGIFIGMTETAMIHGDECNVCPLVWRSCKIGPMCKSPSAAEAKALCDGEDEINAVRYQLAEMLGLDNPDDDNEEICAKIPAVLATDSKNTYDTMGKVAAFLNSKEI